MGRPKYICEYCDKSFEDSQDARKRHFSGRNHKANVKLWYDSFSDQARRHGTAANPAPAVEWLPVAPSSGATATPEALVQDLPPSMIPPPPEVFLFCRSDWG